MPASSIPVVPVRTPMHDDEGRLTRTWIIFFERLLRLLGAGEGGAGELKATFGIVRSLEVAESLTNIFICRNAGTFADLAVVAKIPPSGQAARVDIKKSSDEGASWASIFAAGYVELAADDDTLQLFTDVFAEGDAGTIAEGELLRIDGLQIGTVLPGKEIEFVVRWE